MKMKTKKQKIIAGIGTLILIILILLIYRKREIKILVPEDKNYIQEKIEIKPSLKNKNTKEKEIISPATDIKITIKVLDREYTESFKDNSSVFEIMKELEQMDKSFTFKYKEVSGLGSFVTEINEVKGKPGKYWIYYVNDKLASVGVSKFILKNGDIINWKNEGI